MRKIVYYVATSLDGFIAGPNDDISGFMQGGEGVDQYRKDLQHFDTVIMGKNTYEFGYQYGLEPGSPAYPHMKHYIFSEKLSFETKHENVQVCAINLNKIDELKNQEGTDIYLCGGGIFANWLLENERIDLLKVKLNPFIQGKGTDIFNNASKPYQLNLLSTVTYDQGLMINTYKINY